MKKALISIVIFALTLGLGGVALAEGTAFFSFEPTVINTDLGNTFTIDVIADPNGELIDTARALVEFDDDMLELQYYELGSLFPNIAPGNYVDNSDGFVSMGGYLKGIQESNSGVFATIAFKSKLAGTSSLNFVEGTKMISIGEEKIDLSGSGQATVNVNAVALEDIPEFKAVMAEIELPGQPTVEIDETTGEEIEVPSGLRIVSPSHSNQNVWQTLNDIEMVWGITGAPSVEIVEYNSSFNKEPQADPGSEHVTTDTAVSIEGVEDGVWYFHIKALLANGRYTDSAHYRILIDTEAPNPVVPVLDFDTIEAGKGVYLRFRTTDQASGIEFYQINIDDQKYMTGGNEMLVSDLAVGKHKITVTAYDRAGNWTSGETTLTVTGSFWQSSYFIVGIILLIALVTILIFRKTRRSRARPRLGKN